MKIYTWLIIALLFFLIAGCSWMFKGGGSETIVKTGGQQLISATNKIGWLPFLSIIGIGFCATALANGSKTAFGGIIGCSVILVLSVTVAKYASWLALGTLVVGAGFIILSLFEKSHGLSFEKLLSKKKGKK